MHCTPGRIAKAVCGTQTSSQNGGSVHRQKESGPASWGRRPAFTHTGQPSEDDFQSQLHVEGFTGTNSWRAVVVADGIRGHAQTTAGQADAVALHGGIGISDPATAVGRREVLRLNRLNSSMRNCVLTRSVMRVFLTTEKSTSPKPGP